MGEYVLFCLTKLLLLFYWKKLYLNHCIYWLATGKNCFFIAAAVLSVFFTFLWNEFVLDLFYIRFRNKITLQHTDFFDLVEVATRREFLIAGGVKTSTVRFLLRSLCCKHTKNISSQKPCHIFLWRRLAFPLSAFFSFHGSFIKDHKIFSRLPYVIILAARPKEARFPPPIWCVHQWVLKLLPLGLAFLYVLNPPVTRLGPITWHTFCWNLALDESCLNTKLFCIKIDWKSSNAIQTSTTLASKIFNGTGRFWRMFSWIFPSARYISICRMA